MGPTPSSLKLSFLSFHSGREDIEYAMEVAGTYREPLDRQLTEKVNISNFKGSILINCKNELGGANVEMERYKYRRRGAGVK